MVASRRRFAASCVAVVAVAAFTVAGCGGGSGGSDGSATQDSRASDTSTAATVAGLDACTLVSADDITKLLGSPIEGRALGTDPQMPACTWENRETYESVTVEIGNPGTAVNGTLPPAEPGFPDVGTPGPDGMRILGSGMVEFPAGGRSNTVQVAVLALLGPDADNAAIDLARKIGPQIPAQ